MEVTIRFEFLKGMNYGMNNVFDEHLDHVHKFRLNCLSQNEP